MNYPKTMMSGVVLMGMGVWLRLSARELAWPKSYSYSGPRENTGWHFAEVAYVDLAWFALVFGAVLVLTAVILGARRGDKKE